MFWQFDKPSYVMVQSLGGRFLSQKLKQYAFTDLFTVSQTDLVSWQTLFKKKLNIFTEEISTATYITFLAI